MARELWDRSSGPRPGNLSEIYGGDGGNGTGTYDELDTITLVFSDLTDRAGLPEELTYEEINSVFSFNQNLGNNYTGKWLQTGVWVSPLGPGIVPDVPYASMLDAIVF